MNITAGVLWYDPVDSRPTAKWGLLTYYLHRQSDMSVVWKQGRSNWASSLKEIVLTSDQDLLILIFKQDDYYSGENTRKFYRVNLPYNEDEFKNAKPLKSFL